MASETILREVFSSVSLAVEGRTEGELNGEPWIEVPALTFIAGQPGGKRSYNEADLQEMVDYFEANQTPKGEDDWVVPIQKKHSDDPDDTRGNVRKMWRQGKELWTRLRFVGAFAVAKVKQGFYRKLSAGICWDEKHPDKPWIDEVTVTPFPRVEAAQTFSKGGKTMADKKEKCYDDMSDEEKAAYNAKKKADEEAAAKAAEAKAKAEKDKNARSEDPEITRMREDFDRRMTEQSAQLAQLQDQLSKTQARERMTKDTAEVERFVNTGKTAPANAKAELEFIGTLTETQREAFVKVKETSPAFVGFTRVSTPGTSRDGFTKDGDNAEDAKNQADQFMKSAGYAEKDGKWTKA